MSKTTVVTGASRGIGFEICKALAEKDHHVIAVARSEKPLSRLQESYPKFIDARPVDLTKNNDIKQLASHVANTYGNVDILINNAGVLINKPFLQLTMEEWQKMINVNLYAAVELVKEFIPILSEEAHIVNISSMGGYQGSAKFPGLSAYSVAKGALSILSECLAVELSENKIRSNALCLGAVKTEMLEEAFPGFEPPVQAEQMGAYIARFALEGHTFYNGQVLPVTLGDPD